MPLMLNLVTDHGELDLAFRPSGQLDGFEGWREHARQVEVAPGLTVSVAALDDVIDSKRAANRPKDNLGLVYLESLREQIEGQ